MNKTRTALSLGLSFLLGSVGAAEIEPNYGIGYSARLVFQKSDTKKGAPALTLHSGETLNSPGGETTVIPMTKSMAWCDPAILPGSGTVPGTCYGWAMHAKWFLIDLSNLKKQGLGSVIVTIDARRYAGPNAENNDLIPAITVWRGYQNLGPHLHWFPSQFQATPDWWGWQLAPFTDKTNPGFLSAKGVGDESIASVSGKFKLKGKNQDFLTVAVGGDAKHDDPAQKHDVNFELVVDVKRVPTAGGGGGGGGGLDPYGCVIGKTCWHPPMNHCMSVDLCNLPQYQGECLCY
ncbi:MAG TPA: hypothetical protein VNL74_03215 [Methylococcus sp.]|nr:hypothetical protein [Methylococcus sp.]